MAPEQSVGFLRRYQLNWDPENVHFGKMHFRDPNIDARFLKELPGAFFYVLRFPLCYLKKAQKGSKVKKNAEK